jgi:hypothetical protein
MRRAANSVIVVLVAAAVTAAVTFRFVPQKLSLSQLRSAPLPPIPAQPIHATIECRGGLNIKAVDAGREWSVVQDHPPCAAGSVVVPFVKATAAEMSEIIQRPQVTFKVAIDGLTTEGVVVRSSGSKTLDARALTQIMETRYPRQQCGICKLSTEVNIDFHGPVWFHDTTFGW